MGKQDKNGAEPVNWGLFDPLTNGNWLNLIASKSKCLKANPRINDICMKIIY